MEANGDRPSYFVLTYDRATSQVLSLSGHGHDFTAAVLTLTARLQHHRHHPSVAVRLLVATDLPRPPGPSRRAVRGAHVPGRLTYPGAGNVARQRAPLHSPEMGEFVVALDPVNRLAEGSPGFVWRLRSSESHGATVLEDGSSR